MFKRQIFPRARFRVELSKADTINQLFRLLIPVQKTNSYARVKWLKTGIPLLAVICGGVFWLSTRGSGGIRYHERTLRSWFSRLNQPQAESVEAKAAIKEMGVVAVPYLTEQATNRPLVRMQYVRIRSYLADCFRTTSPTPPPIDWLSRIHAATMLGEIGPKAKEAIPALIALLTSINQIDTDQTFAPPTKHNRDEFQAAILTAVGKINPNDSRVFRSAITALRENASANSQNVVSDAAEWVLEQSTALDSENIFTILETLQTRNRQIYFERLSPIFSTVARGQSLLGPNGMIEATLLALSGAPAIREAGAGLQRTMQAQSVPSELEAALVTCLSDREIAIRLNAAESLWAAKSTNISQIVHAGLSVLNTGRSFDCLRAIELLRQLGTNAPEALPRLKELATCPVHFVSAWAAKAVGEIAGVISESRSK
jgi:hypothetical protein